MAKKEFGIDHINIEKKYEGVGLREGNVSLILEGYNDIFSDFDPRNYSEKSLSQDFLAECKRAVVEKEGVGELRLLVPKDKRDLNDELKIKRRLREHFQKHFMEKETIRRKEKGEGILLFIFGILLIISATMILEYTKLVYRFLVVIFEPAGWFTAWTGLEKIFLESKESRMEYDFYKKMSNARIYFFSY